MMEGWWCPCITNHGAIYDALDQTCYPLSAEKLSRLCQVHSDLKQDPEAVRDEFYGFLLGVADSWTERQHREEGSIVAGF